MSLVNPAKASEMTLGATSNLLNNTINGAISTGINNAIEKNRLANLSRVSIGNGNNLGALYGKLFIPQLVYYSLYDYQIKEMEAYFDLFGYSYKAQFNYNSRLIEDNRTRTYYNYVQASAFNLFIGLNQSNKNDIITRFMNGIILYHVRDNKIMNESKGDSYNEEYNFIYDKTTYRIFINDALTYSGEVNKVFNTKADASKYFYSLYPDMNNYLSNYENFSETYYSNMLYTLILYYYNIYLNDELKVSETFTSDKILSKEEVKEKILELNPTYNNYDCLDFTEEITHRNRSYKLYLINQESFGETEIKDLTEKLNFVTDNVLTYSNNLSFMTNGEQSYYKFAKEKTYLFNFDFIFYETDSDTVILTKNISQEGTCYFDHYVDIYSGAFILNENRHLYFGSYDKTSDENKDISDLIAIYLSGDEYLEVFNKRIKIILNSITEVDS